MLVKIAWILTVLAGLTYITNKKKYYVSTFAFTYLFSIYISVNMWYVEQSIVQSGIAFIVSLYSAYLIYLVLTKDLRPRNICKMAAITGTFLLPLYSIDIVREYMIQNVINETNSILNFIGYDSIVSEQNGKYYIIFEENQLRTEIVLACTGVGSISIFVGLISSINNISIYKRISFIMIVSGLIYTLNTVRNVFIAASYGGQHLHMFPGIIEYIFGNGEHWVSYYIADKIISQFLAAIVLIYLVVFIFNSIGEKSAIEDEIINIIDSTIILYEDIKSDMY